MGFLTYKVPTNTDRFSSAFLVVALVQQGCKKGVQKSPRSGPYLAGTGLTPRMRNSTIQDSYVHREETITYVLHSGPICHRLGGF